MLLGNSKLMKNNKFHIMRLTLLVHSHMAIDGEYKGNIVISDEVKENAKEALIN